MQYVTSRQGWSMFKKGDKIVFLLDKRTRKVEFIRANEMIDNLAGILSDKVPNKLKTVPINEAIEKGKIFYYEKIYKE